VENWEQRWIPDEQTWGLRAPDPVLRVVREKACLMPAIDFVFACRNGRWFLLQQQQMRLLHCCTIADDADAS